MVSLLGGGETCLHGVKKKGGNMSKRERKERKRYGGEKKREDIMSWKHVTTI